MHFGGLPFIFSTVFPVHLPPLSFFSSSQFPRAGWWKKFCLREVRHQWRHEKKSEKISSNSDR
jgi:hypothetical protein